MKKTKLKCPVCGYERLIDASVHNRSILFPESKMPTGWEPDYYQKCPRCKNEIGIKKVS